VSKSARPFVVVISATADLLMRPLVATDHKGETVMSKVSMMGTITCQDGKADEMAEVLAQMVEAAREEPGVEIYSYHRGEGNNFSFFALMTDQDAMQNHGQGEAMQAAMQAFGPLMAEPPQMAPATPIAAIGFEL
jgi:quinol monooxygenase YgiN